MDSLDYFPELELSSQISSRVLAQRSPNVVFSAAGFRAAALARSTAGPLMLTTRSSNDVRAYSSHAPPGGPESPVVRVVIWMDTLGAKNFQAQSFSTYGDAPFLHWHSQLMATYSCCCDTISLGQISHRRIGHSHFRDER